MGKLTLVLGGARSGKSAFAERLAAATARDVVYVATADASDAEMADRIARHRVARPPSWRTLEWPRDLPAKLERDRLGDATLLIDCLSVWLSNELLALPLGGSEDLLLEPAAAAAFEARALGAVETLVVTALKRGGDTIVVSNEVGSGVVPAFALGRVYRDVLGRANQHIARQCGSVYLVVAGIGVDLRRLAAALDPATLSSEG